MIEQIKEQIKVVVEARREALEAWEWRASAYQKWVGANQPLLDNESTTKNICQEAETTLRELTLLSYAETGNKAPVPGVGIREMTKLDYDKTVAFGWAIEHAMALKLDTTAFEKIAKASPLDFVRTYQELQATIATQLEVVE